MKGWSTEELLRCAEMLKEGATSKEIGFALDRSKGSIIGMVGRHPDLKKIGFANPPLPLTIHQRKIAELRLKRRDGRTIILGRAIGKTLVELDSAACRFPLWAHDVHLPVEEQRFCAMPKAEDSSYCPRHRDMCRSKPRGM